MDSVIAKLDGSVFGMLIDQPPHILIAGVQEEDLEMINRVRPDFVCLDHEDLKKDLCPVVRVLKSPDDLPVISGIEDPRALTLKPGTLPEEAVKLVRGARPDTVILTLKDHNDEEHSQVRQLIKELRSVRSEMVD